MIATETIIYQDESQSYEGVIAYDSETNASSPIIMIAHAYGGQAQFDVDKAIALAELGYVGFAIDYYGQGIRASGPEEAMQLMNNLNADRSLLLQRMQTALNTAKALHVGDVHKIGAIGFCFGGKCVLDLVRSGEQFAGAVSFHGVYDPPAQTSPVKIKTPVLIQHGWDDPLATPQDVLNLTEELTAKGGQWELDAYGHVGHAFTNPKADRQKEGMFYDATADKRSWNRMKAFFEEVFNNT